MQYEFHDNSEFCVGMMQWIAESIFIVLHVAVC